jgi:hypothetical protein
MFSRLCYQSPSPRLVEGLPGFSPSKRGPCQLNSVSLHNDPVARCSLSSPHTYLSQWYFSEDKLSRLFNSLFSNITTSEIKLLAYKMQNIRAHDGGFNYLLRNLHALRFGRPTQELSPLRMPFHQLQRAGHAGIPVVQLLEVSLQPSHTIDPHTNVEPHEPWLTYSSSQCAAWADVKPL